ncbi:hypothetical protein GCM10009760_42310 [Kitasatospora kazusensis]|uniref:Uncharacterized protein n=1 Tax=Kitasatospora kazusensis TaxID=407974 RepID=A0ABN2ZXE7_9ACTN
MENIASLALSEVGRVVRPGGTARRRPPAVPPITRVMRGPFVAGLEHHVIPEARAAPPLGARIGTGHPGGARGYPHAPLSGGPVYSEGSEDTGAVAPSSAGEA